MPEDPIEERIAKVEECLARVPEREYYIDSSGVVPWLIAQLREARTRLIRMSDLVRYQRQELHTADLISNEEYGDLLQISGVVARLESYDETRAALRKVEQERDELTSLIPSTFYADRPLPERLEKLVYQWNRLHVVNQQLEQERDELEAHFKDATNAALTQKAALDIAIQERDEARRDAERNVILNKPAARWRKMRKTVLAEKVAAHETKDPADYAYNIAIDHALAVIDRVAGEDIPDTIRAPLS